MEIEKRIRVVRESNEIQSLFLERTVKVDCYLPTDVSELQELSLLLINDGQDMEKLAFEAILGNFYENRIIAPLLCVGIHAGPERKMEYGTGSTPDYKGRGARANNYASFILEELMPFIRTNYNLYDFKEKAFAGFSLGGLSALDIVWNHPQEFTRVGIFSGSFWWRTKDKLDRTYSDENDRIMQRQIREGDYYPWLKFFFECGTEDEREDRNQNGIIDSIDDTLDIIDELVAKGYTLGRDIRYLQLEGGRHDIPTWGKAMPEFLEWGWGL
jgi:enterochelin esterase-like enzyme